MKNLNPILTLTTIVLLCTFCDNKSNIEYSEVQLETISNGIPVNLPGRLFIDGEFIYVETPTSTDYGLRLYSINSGEEIGRYIKKGRGPDEFVSSVIQQVNEGIVFFMSYNPRKEIKMQIINAFTGETKFTDLSESNIEHYTSILHINDTTRIALQPGKRNIFRYITPTFEVDFGDLFSIDLIENGYNELQGEIVYNPFRGIFVYSAFRIAYLAVFEYKSGTMNLVKEIKDTKQYKLDRNKIITKVKQTGCRGISFTKDFIVTIQRDYNKDLTDEQTVGRDFMKLPHTLFIYSYDGICRKIIDLNSPIVRIAGTQHMNTVYAIIYQDKEFKIVKFRL